MPPARAGQGMRNVRVEGYVADASRDSPSAGTRYVFGGYVTW
jgi:hypothetical protein